VITPAQIAKVRIFETLLVAADRAPGAPRSCPELCKPHTAARAGQESLGGLFPSSTVTDKFPEHLTLEI
jgi:hypothetical protein